MSVIAFTHSHGDLHPAQESNFNLEGKVVQKSEGKLTVSTAGNIVFHVRYDVGTITQPFTTADPRSKPTSIFCLPT